MVTFRYYIHLIIQILDPPPPPNGVSLRAHDGPTLHASLIDLWFLRESGPVLLRNPIFFVIFLSGGRDVYKWRFAGGPIGPK